MTALGNLVFKKRVRRNVSKVFGENFQRKCSENIFRCLNKNFKYLTRNLKGNVRRKVSQKIFEEKIRRKCSKKSFNGTWRKFSKNMFDEKVHRKCWKKRLKDKF